MKIKLTARSGHPQFDFPAPMYFIAKAMQAVPAMADFLHDLESAQLTDKIKDIKVKSPAYVTGLARAGTTIVLEMLSQHPDVASHRYLHMVMPYLPHWFKKFADMTPIMTSPVERLHKDGLLVTRDSPEAVEEQFWQRYFEGVLDESTTGVLDAKTSNSRFERFYTDNIRKLLYNQSATRYVAKNNYNVSRLEYILKIFPDAKFIIMVRNPFDHVASLAKQDAVLGRLESEDPRLLEMTKMIGHREFGSAKVCINTGNRETVREIRRLWMDSKTYVRGWARYWASIYSYVLQRLGSNKEIAEASLLVRYEDLCEEPGETIDRMVEHLHLDPGVFTRTRERYIAKLHKPTYYRPKYTERERDGIISETDSVAQRFGYDLSHSEKAVARPVN
jgi:hypothetical protein